MGRAKLGFTRGALWERYKASALPLKNPSAADLVSNKIEKIVVALLTDLGVDYPLDFIVAPPDRLKTQRQGTFQLQPSGYPAVFGPSTRDFTFKARDKGFLVIPRLDIIAEEPIAEGFRIEYLFNGNKNSPNYQVNKSVSEAGHWKFSGMVLADADELIVRVTNPSTTAAGVASIEADLWGL